ncbi:hypothetical protein QYF36_001492 [Acer negundo]|nr:hypothetical protein QYF36_001492 [Acer negundo]
MAADHSCSQSSPTHNYKNPIPCFLVSPRFKAFTTKCLAESTHEVVNSSPTSTLDTKQLFSSFANPFCWYELNPPTKSPKFLSESKQYFSRDQKLADSKGIGLALVDILTHNDHKTIEDKSKSSSSSSSSSISSNKMVIFGTNLRVQIPPLPPSNISPADFGIKTKNNTQLSPTGSANSSTQTKDSSRVVTGCLSATEMELSEDYTCVISHGPKPKTTHIFDNCIIESYYSSSDKLINSLPENFLSFCYTCKKNLEQKNDIYIYRGEKAFCSQECRYQEMLVDGPEN